MSKGHVHAELMAQYAEDAKETDRPWERWEVKITLVSNPRYKDGYRTCECHPSWHPNHVYRRKPTQVQVAGEVFDDVVLRREDRTSGIFVVNSVSLEVVPAGSTDVPGDTYSGGKVHTTYEGALRHLNALRPKVL